MHGKCKCKARKVGVKCQEGARKVPGSKESARKVHGKRRCKAGKEQGREGGSKVGGKCTEDASQVKCK